MRRTHKPMMAHYRFYDRTLDVRLPHDLLRQWDLLYGAFREELDAPASITVVCSESDNGRVVLDVDSRSRRVARESVLIYLQDIVQNQVFASVRTHMLWHAAAWNVNGNGVMILGESGLGKTTLSLAEQVSGGCVMSDEIAAWNPEKNLLESFPRAMAVRPTTFMFVDETERYPRLHLDEEKAIVPLARGQAAVPLRKVVILGWALDEPVASGESICEVNVSAADTQWQAALGETVGGDVVFSAHPDGGGWWRCRSLQPIPTLVLESAIAVSGGFLIGFHREARRRPDYNEPTALTPLTTDDAVKGVLPELLNARQWMDAESPAYLLGHVRSVLSTAHCFACVPGRLAETQEVIRLY